METNKRPTQCERIIRYMYRNGSITQDITECEFGCKRLPSRINELRKEGYKFITVTETGVNRYGESCSWTRYFIPQKEVIGYARVRDVDREYDIYESWVKRNAPIYLQCYNERHWERLQNGRACEILCKAPHGRDNTELYLIRVDGRVYLIGEKGLAKIKIIKLK